jgi:hypothetical protein
MAAAGHFRAHARRPARFPVTVSDTDGSFRVAAELLDLGLGGAGVRLTESPMTSILKFELVAPHLWDPLCIDADVAWTQKEADGRVRLGLRFRPRTGAALRALTEILTGNVFE